MTEGMEQHGWDIMEVESSKNFDDAQQAWAAGYIEAAVSTNKIYDAFRNLVNGTSASMSPAIKTFIQTNLAWLRSNANSTDSYWQQVLGGFD